MWTGLQIYIETPHKYIHRNEVYLHSCIIHTDTQRDYEMSFLTFNCEIGIRNFFPNIACDMNDTLLSDT